MGEGCAPVLGTELDITGIAGVAAAALEIGAVAEGADPSVIGAEILSVENRAVATCPTAPGE